MDRPSGSDEESRKAREKWFVYPLTYRLLMRRREAWKSCANLSRTDAKRQYISTLIASMRKYAASSPDSRELVDELEFVWDQVKSNVSPTSSSSPTHNNNDNHNGLGITSPIVSGTNKSPTPPPMSFIDRLTSAARGKAAVQVQTAPQGKQLRQSTDLRGFTSSPLSHSAMGDESSDEEEDVAEYVDAPDSQIAADESPPRISRRDSDIAVQQQPPPPQAGVISTALAKIRSIPPTSQPIQSNNTGLGAASSSKDRHLPHADHEEQQIYSPRTKKQNASASRARYRARIESTLTRLTAEVAALREQQDLSYSRSFSSRFFSPPSDPSDRPDRWSFWARLLLQGLGFLAKVVVVDLVILVVVLTWMRRKKKDGRLEGAVRVLLGDAVAVMQRVGKEATKGVGRVGRVVGKNIHQARAGTGVKKT
jgi:hypothetical protein